MEEIYMKAIEKWGLDLQVNMAIEEMAELTHALMKHRRDPDNIDKIIAVIDEIADVIIMINQIKIIFGKEEIDSHIDTKLKRVKKKLDK